MIYTTGALREHFGMDLMSRIEKVLNDNYGRKKPYYLLVNTQKNGFHINTTIMIMNRDQFPRNEQGRVIPMLGTILFMMDNQKGKLEIVWALPHDIPMEQEIYGEVVQSVAQQAWNLNMPIICS